MNLVVCSGCARHVRQSESSCPFCGTEVAPDAIALPAPNGRMSRAAQVAAAAVIAAAPLVACGGNQPAAEQPNDLPVAVYGAPAPTDSATPPPSDPPPATSGEPTTDQPPTNVVPMYGAPVAPAYGGPPPAPKP